MTVLKGFKPYLLQHAVIALVLDVHILGCIEEEEEITPVLSNNYLVSSFFKGHHLDEAEKDVLHRVATI